MAEIRRGYGGDPKPGERLPWLEPVEDEDDDAGGGGGGGFGGVILAVVVVLAGIALIAGGVMWVRHRRAAYADLGTVIRAPATPYKVRPADPGGMEIASSGAVAERTGVGGDINSPLDLTAIPEEPVAVARVGAAPAVVVAPAVTAAPVATAPVSPPVAATTVIAKAVPAKTAAPVALPLHQPAAGPPPRPGEELAAGTIQLGAFSSEAKARAAWKVLSGRFGFLKAMEMAIGPVQVGEATLYRLRASGPGAAGACARLKVAGETCSRV